MKLILGLLMACLMAGTPVAQAKEKENRSISDFYRIPIYPRFKNAGGHVALVHLQEAARSKGLMQAINEKDLSIVADYMTGYLNLVFTEINAIEPLRTRHMGFSYVKNGLALSSGNKSIPSFMDGSLVCVISIDPSKLKQLSALLLLAGSESVDLMLRGYIAHEIYHCEDSMAFRLSLVNKTVEMGLDSETIMGDSSKELAADIFSFFYISKKFNKSKSAVLQYKNALSALRGGIPGNSKGYGYRTELLSALSKVELGQPYGYKSSTELAIFELGR